MSFKNVKNGTLQKVLLISILMIMFSCKEAPKNYLNESQEEIDARMEWWHEAKFGMFIHWGPYAVPAGEYKGERVEGIGEWIMNSLEIPVDEYRKFAEEFNPVDFDAGQWVKIAKDAGMKYIVITSKHHDGFCMWDTKYNDDWNIVDTSPFGRDVLKELADACEKEGIRLCFYYSIMDWHHPDAQAIFEPNYNQGRDSEKVNPNFERYVENYMKPQLKELLTQYGDIGVIWFDGEWIPDYTSEMGKDVYNYLRNIKPDLIINNRVDVGRQGMMGMNEEGDFAGDFGTPEKQIPDTGMPGEKWESCLTMNDTWGYKYFDDNWKSSELLIHNLIDIASKGGNLLLNVGPTAEGIIPQPSVDRLRDMGEWMKTNSEAIYGVDPSPVDSPEWGRYTTKGNVIYAHVFDWPSDGVLNLDALDKIGKAWLLADDRKDELHLENENGQFIQLPQEAPDKVATVIVLEKAKKEMPETI
ncbi:MAG: alpha-L-fucosidase [Bacteroidota bacterium]